MSISGWKNIHYGVLRCTANVIAFNIFLRNLHFKFYSLAIILITTGGLFLFFKSIFLINKILIGRCDIYFGYLLQLFSLGKSNWYPSLLNTLCSQLSMFAVIYTNVSTTIYELSITDYKIFPIDS